MSAEDSNVTTVLMGALQEIHTARRRMLFDRAVVLTGR